jgi:hypothetical protein
METVGGLHTATAFAMVNGIGDGISDFLDDYHDFHQRCHVQNRPYKEGWQTRDAWFYGRVKRVQLLDRYSVPIPYQR